MLWQFVFLNCLFVSLGVLLYLVIRALPRIDGEPVKRGMMERWLTSELPERLDQFFNIIYVRTLRRMRVWVLKADNSLHKKITTIKMERDDLGAGSRFDIRSVTEKSVEEVGEETGTE